MVPAPRTLQTRITELACPICAAPVAVRGPQLMDGAAVTCPFCRGESLLLREWLVHEARAQWSLVEDDGDD